MNRNMMKVCANCKQNYIEGDKYCRYCGAPMGTPFFIEEDFNTIYGPPPKKRVHTCSVCGYTWKTSLMIDKEKWCPMCGGPAPVTECDDNWLDDTIPFRR